MGRYWLLVVKMGRLVSGAPGANRSFAVTSEACTRQPNGKVGILRITTWPLPLHNSLYSSFSQNFLRYNAASCLTFPVHQTISLFLITAGNGRQGDCGPTRAPDHLANEKVPTFPSPPRGIVVDQDCCGDAQQFAPGWAYSGGGIAVVKVSTVRMSIAEGVTGLVLAPVVVHQNSGHRDREKRPGEIDGVTCGHQVRSWQMSLLGRSN